jgi:hypothetical protein
MHLIRHLADTNIPRIVAQGSICRAASCPVGSLANLCSYDKSPIKPDVAVLRRILQRFIVQVRGRLNRRPVKEDLAIRGRWQTRAARRSPVGLRCDQKTDDSCTFHPEGLLIEAVLFPRSPVCDY